MTTLLRDLRYGTRMLARRFRPSERPAKRALVSEVEPIPLRDAPGKTRRIQTAKDFLALTERDRTLVRAALLLAQAISLSNGVCDAFVDAGPDVAVA